MANQLNTEAENHARTLIDNGKVNETDSWSFDASDENAILGDPADWSRYALWHLGTDPSLADETKARYKYPYGKNGEVYRSALRAIASRGAQNGNDSISSAASALIKRIDKGKGASGVKHATAPLAAAPQLALARFLFNRPLAISRLGFKQLSDNLLIALKVEKPSLRAMFGLMDDMEPCDDPYDLDQSTGIATIEVHGVLVNRADSFWASYCGCPSYDDLGAAFGLALEDPAVKAIVFDFDSPGGEVEGCFDLADQIYAARGMKPIAALVNESAFSAAYALASAADRVYVPRTGGVGSIGVICEHWDYSGLLEQMGIKVTAIYAGEHKNDGSPYEPLSADAKAEIQRHVDASNGLFISTVARNRGMSAENVQGTQAAVFYGVSGAVESGLADAVLAPPAALAVIAGQGSGQSPLRLQAERIAELEGQLAAAATEVYGREEAAREGVWGHVADVIARSEVAHRAALAIPLLKERVPAENLGARLADLLAQQDATNTDPHHDSVNGPALNALGAAVQELVKRAAERRLMN